MDVSVGLVSQLVYDNELVFYIFSLFCVPLIIILEGLRFLIFGALVRESNSRTIMIGVVSCVLSLLSVEKFWIVISLVSMLGRFLSVKFIETLPRFFHLPKTVSTFYFLFYYPTLTGLIFCPHILWGSSMTSLFFELR